MQYHTKDVLVVFGDQYGLITWLKSKLTTVRSNDPHNHTDERIWTAEFDRNDLDVMQEPPHFFTVFLRGAQETLADG